MRPHRALFHLVLRHTVWKVLLLLLLLAAAQWSAFLCLSPDPASIGLADAFSLSGGALAGLLALAFLLLSALLLLATTGWGARCPGYTLAPAIIWGRPPGRKRKQQAARTKNVKFFRPRWSPSVNRAAVNPSPAARAALLTHRPGRSRGRKK